MKYLRKSDVFVTIIILLLDAVLLFLFFSSIYIASNYGATEKLGVLVFKKRMATRKHVDSFSWNMLGNESPVYELDAIRTASQSEASIIFDDGSSIDLLENTLIKLKKKNSSELGDFLHGSLVFSSTGAKKSVNVAGRVLTMSENSEIVIHKRGEGENEIEVTRGYVEVADDEGGVVVIEDAKKITISENADNEETKLHVEDIVCMPISPSQNERLLTSKDAFNITFSWSFPKTLDRGSSSSKLMLFQDSECKKPIGEVRGQASNENPNLYSASYFANVGVIYWYVEYDGGTSSIRKLELEKALGIEQVKPAEGDVIYYYEDFPPITFSWSSPTISSSCILEISKTEDFSHPELKMQVFPSSIELAKLLEGKYYWRVYPNTNKTVLGGVVEPSVRSFSVVKKEVLTDVKLKFPIDGYLCNINSFAIKGLSVTWESKNEASEYELLLYANKEDESPKETISSSLPFVKLTKEQTKMFEDVGDVYFAVRYKSRKGNYSNIQAKRCIKKVNYDINLKSIYPPDGYTIATSLMMSQRFSWKHTLPIKTFFVIAKDKDFKNIIMEKEIAIFSITGLNLKPDNYYWQVRAYNIDKSLFAQTEARAFSVVEPLDAPPMLFPRNNELIPVVEDKELEVRWQGVKGADYYDVSLYKDGKGKSLAHYPLVRSTRLQLPINLYGEGKYSVEIQAFKLDSALSTKNVGYKGYCSFKSRMLSYVTLEKPFRNVRMDGIASYTNGVKFSYTAKDACDTISLLLRKNGQVISPKTTHDKAHSIIDVSSLGSGEYEWSINASLAGYNLSSKEVRRFTVLPIPPLPAPDFIYKKMVEKIDVDYLRNNRMIHFEWQPVQDASYYVVQIKNEKTGQVVKTVSNLKETSFDFYELEKLNIGKFSFKVRAVSMLNQSMEVRTGYDASYSFEIALPSFEEIDLKDEEYYGY